jgi:hypothetical protein
MLDVWLIPVLLVGMGAILGLYLLIRSKGGSGTRTDGRTVVDRPDEE